MAYGTLADLDERIRNPKEIIPGVKVTIAPVVGRWQSLWATAPLAGVAPTAAVVPARDLQGALGQQNGDTTALRIPAIRASSFAISGAGLYVLCDRLSHQGGLSGTVATTQTTNLPTAALTRYTSGKGVWCCLEIYSAVGSTSTAVTASYTNQAGTAGQTTIVTTIGSASFSGVGRMIHLPCAIGDDGFRAVASITLAASTLTAGNFGVTLVRPLLWVPLQNEELETFDSIRGSMGGQLPEIFDDACLFWMWLPLQASASGFAYEVLFAEDV